MEISNLAGLPAHPLIVHAVVVLVPLTALGVFLSAVWPAAREKIGWITVGFATICVVLIPMATGSGENLQERVDETRLVEDHAELANRMLPWVIVLFVAAVLVMALAWYRKRLAAQAAEAGEGTAVQAPGWVKIAVPVVMIYAIIASIGGVYITAVVGHSGAKASWEKVANAPANG